MFLGIYYRLTQDDLLPAHLGCPRKKAVTRLMLHSTIHSLAFIRSPVTLNVFWSTRTIVA